jgi:hypothetical protein
MSMVAKLPLLESSGSTRAAADRHVVVGQWPNGAGVGQRCRDLRIGVLVFFPDRPPLRRHHQKSRFGTRNSVLAPCRDWDLEEIFITIITDVSPSTIHDSPIHE